jgi:hypothetical protein
MIHKIKLWIKCWRAIATWRYMIEYSILKMEGLEGAERESYLAVIATFEQNIGKCVLRLLGIYPLEDWDINDTLDNP